MSRCSKKITIDLIIPCYNEQATISKLISELDLMARANKLNFTYILVNDGSKDNTLKTLRSLQTTYHNSKIINFSRNFGKEAALTAGIDHSTGDVAIPIDADGQEPPSAILEMLKYWEQGANHILGVRIDRSSDSWLKRNTAKLFYRCYNLCSSQKIANDGGDFRLLDRKCINYIKQLREQNRFMKGILSWPMAPDAIVYFTRETRTNGKSSFGAKSLISLAANAMFSFSTWPLRIWGIIGIFISLLSVIYGSYITIRVISFGRDLPGYASIFVAVLFLGGIQLISLSLLGEYIARILTEVKQRPLYLIDNIYQASPNLTNKIIEQFIATEN